MNTPHPATPSPETPTLPPAEPIGETLSSVTKQAADHILDRCVGDPKGAYIAVQDAITATRAADAQRIAELERENDRIRKCIKTEWDGKAADMILTDVETLRETIADLTAQRDTAEGRALDRQEQLDALKPKLLASGEEQPEVEKLREMLEQVRRERDEARKASELRHGILRQCGYEGRPILTASDISPFELKGMAALRQQVEELTRERNAALQKAESRFDCHGGPGTTQEACKACLTCVMRDRDAEVEARIALDNEASALRTRFRFRCGEAEADTRRLDWLERHVVEVRLPLVHGSRAMFYATPEDDDGYMNPSDIRSKIDAAARPTETTEG